VRLGDVSRPTDNALYTRARHLAGVRPVLHPCHARLAQDRLRRGLRPLHDLRIGRSLHWPVHQERGHVDFALNATTQEGPDLGLGSLPILARDQASIDEHLAQVWDDVHRAPPVDDPNTERRAADERMLRTLQQHLGVPLQRRDNRRHTIDRVLSPIRLTAVRGLPMRADAPAERALVGDDHVQPRGLAHTGHGSLEQGRGEANHLRVGKELLHSGETELLVTRGREQAGPLRRASMRYTR